MGSTQPVGMMDGLPTLADFGIVTGVRRTPWVEPISFFERVVGYRPYPQQRAFHLASERIKIVAGGKRTGKSFMAAREVEPLIVTPETHGWIVGATYRRGQKEFQYIWDDLVKRAHLGTFEKNNNVRGGYMNIRFAHDSIVEVRSAKDENDLEAEALDWVILAEPAQLRESVFELCRERIAEKRGVMIMCGTPPPARHWLKSRFDRGPDPEWEDYWSIRIPATEAPYPGLDEVAKLERELSPLRYRRDVLAEFISPEELVLGEFDYLVHVDDIEYNRDLPLYWAFDFGYTAPWVCLWVQVDLAEKRVYVLREHYKCLKTDEENIRAVKSTHRATGWARTAMNVGDPHGPASRKELENQGVLCTGMAGSSPGEKERGIELLRQLLKVRGDKKPGIVISRDCENLADECGLWAIDTRTEAPMDKDDHGPLALIYLLLELFEQQQPEISFV